MRYRFTAGAALLGALVLSLTPAVGRRHRPPSQILSSVASYAGQS